MGDRDRQTETHREREREEERERETDTDRERGQRERDRHTEQNPREIYRYLTVAHMRTHCTQNSNKKACLYNTFHSAENCMASHR